MCYKSRFISNSSHCSSTILSKHITSALTAVKDHVIKYSETAFNNSNVNYFWSIKHSSEVIEKLRLRNFRGSQVSSFDFSTLYTSLPHDLIKAKLLSLVNWCFNRESKTYLCTSDKVFLATRNMTLTQLVRFARCCTSVLDFHSKNLQITSKLLTQGYRYHKLRKTFGKFFRSYSELLSKFGDISFQEYLSKGISHPVFYGDLVYKLRRVKDTPNFISSGSKIVKRLRRRQYDPVIIERTIGLVLGPCTALYRPFLKHCTLTNKAVGTIWRALSKPPQRRQGPDLRPLWLLVGTPSAIGPELAFSRAEHSLPYSDVTIYIFAISYLLSMLYVYRFLWPLRLGWLLVWCLYKEVYLQIFKCVSFWLHGCCGEWEGWARKPG